MSTTAHSHAQRAHQSAPAPSHPGQDRPLVELLVEQIGHEFLETIGWDWDERVVIFPQAHPLLGWNACEVRGCGRPHTSARGLCSTCTCHWQDQGRPPVADFLSTAVRDRRWPGRERCVVAGCQRPWTHAGNSLCQAHLAQLRKLKLPLEQFLVDPRVTPRLGLGRCSAAACPRDRSGAGPYCDAHSQRRRVTRDADAAAFDEARWSRTTPAISEDERVSLRGLSDLVVVEVLHGFAQRTRNGIMTTFAAVRGLANHALAGEITSLRELDPGQLSKSTRALRNAFLGAADQSACDPATGWASNEWSLHNTGHTGKLRFEAISQDWLRETTKRWVFEELPQRRGSAVHSTLQGHISGIARFSASLRRHRDDLGAVPGALTRADVVDFLNWMAYLADDGQISEYVRHRECASLRLVLRRARSLGLARPGGPLADLAGDVTLVRTDVPAEPDERPGRDLPAEVVKVLVEHLPRLSADPCAELRPAVELLMDTGRRPGEIVNLPLACLERDADGGPVLIWDNYKAGRYGRRLPISEFTAQVILAQQDRVRARFPGTPDSKLKLLPAATRNPDGTKAITHDWISTKHREWIDGLDELTAPLDVIVDGHTVTRDLPFDKMKITLYAWRHTFAQRHADAGVAVDVLCDLIDHSSMTTTQGYYRVSESRRREAVDRVSSMQFDRHGGRVWRPAVTMLDSERVRRGVGEIAVPYGLCTEPSNVAAGGGDCPVRFRCVGCSHFRTDISYLPDLEAYLADLLRNRERLRATVAADDWAVAEAMPSDTEIDKVRTLIRRIKDDLDGLDEDAHAQIQTAVTAVRRARHGVVGLGLPRTRPRLPDLREEHAP